jgi:uncharacterized protein YacL
MADVERPAEPRVPPAPRVGDDPRGRRAPAAVVELLRLLAVIFFAAAGYQVGIALSGAAEPLLGPFNAAGIGIVVGSGLGYALGGVLGRTTVSAVDRSQQALEGVSAEEVVAGVFGGLIGALAGSALMWPVFLLGQPAFAVPLFGFVVLTLGLMGYRAGVARHESMLAIFSGRAGMRPPVTSAAALPRLVDTSVAIDGRVLDVVRAGFLHGRMLVARPVLLELQGLADAGDEVRRAKGRRGLATLEALRREPGILVEAIDDDAPQVPDVDAKLMRIAIDRDAALLTLDTNLARAAALAGVRVLNLHALTLALRPLVVAGDDVEVHLLKPGREPGQAVGYLDDGTMVVVEQARAGVGKTVVAHVTSVLTTANGRMVFGRLGGIDAVAAASAASTAVAEAAPSDAAVDAPA